MEVQIYDNISIIKAINQTQEAQREKLEKAYQELQNNLKKLDSITDDPKWQKPRFRYKDKKGHDHYY